MKFFFLILLIILSGCGIYQKDEKIINSIFSDNLTFEELKKKLDEYTELSDYPNLNE